MKVAIITDQHFGSRGDSIPFLDFYEKFYAETFFPTLDKLGIETLLVLGDTFDRRKYVNFYSLNRSKTMFFDRLQEKNIKVYMLAGNHDTFFKNTNEVNSPNLLLDSYANIEVIDKPTTITIIDHNTQNLISYDVAMIPWMCSENYKDCLEEITNTKSTLCMGHFEIEGFSMYRNMPSGEGLDRKIFSKFDMVFSGHYHHRSNRDNIYYLGNPYELTWSDYDDPRGFHIFDLSTRELEFIKNPNEMFHKIVYDDKTETKDQILKKDLSKYTNCIVKVVVVNKTKPQLFDKFAEKLDNVNPLDVAIIEDFTSELEDDPTDVDQSEGTLTIINKHIDAEDNTDVDPNRLKSLIHELYVEALNLGVE